MADGLVAVADHLDARRTSRFPSSYPPRASVSRFLLPLPDAPPHAAGPSDPPRLQRAIGVVCAPNTALQSGCFTARLGRRFDAVVPSTPRGRWCRCLDRWLRECKAERRERMRSRRSAEA